MNRARSITGGLLGIVLLVLGWLVDRSLVERQRMTDAAATAQARENAYLGAMTLRAAIARMELGLVANVPPEGVEIVTLYRPPPLRISGGSPLPYGDRTASDLIERLASERLSPSGIPEAVLAALELERRGAPNADRRREEVASRLLAGDLPIASRDLPELARQLGVDDDPRAGQVRRKLEEAPSSNASPAFPAFHRSLSGGTLAGWSQSGQRLLHYSLPIEDLLRDAALPERARVAESPDDAATIAVVPDVLGLIVAVDPKAPDPSAVRLLRIALWLGLIVTAAALLLYQTALAREARVLAREKRFLSNVTHELKTPLAALGILGESLVRRRGDPVEYGALITRETTRLHELVDRVLTATRMDEAPRVSCVCPNAIAQSVVSLLSPRAERHSVELRAEIDARDDSEALWDGDAVHRALVNLVENAIEHGGAGGTCTLGMEILSASDSASDSDAVRFVVSDRGPGIRPRDRRRVFERFVRGDSESAGTGLGLHVVEQVARAHGGKVDLETAPGEGCRFSLTLPIRP